jgi:hypothetical protein
MIRNLKVGITRQPYSDFAELKRRRGELLDNPPDPEPEPPLRLRPTPLQSPAKFHLRSLATSQLPDKRSHLCPKIKSATPSPIRK